MSRRPKQSRRSNGAYQMSEFAVAVFCLFFVVVLPLLNLSVVPVRYGLAKSLVDTQVHKLGHCELLSQALGLGLDEAQKKTQKESNALDLSEALRNMSGVEVCKAKTFLEVEAAKLPEEKKTIDKAGGLSTQWLPDGPLGPYTYRLRTRVYLKIAPLALVKLGGLNVPGLTVPLPVTLDEQCIFENLGRDPNTGEYFINE